MAKRQEHGSPLHNSFPDIAATCSSYPSATPTMQFQDATQATETEAEAAEPEAPEPAEAEAQVAEAAQPKRSQKQNQKQQE